MTTTEDIYANIVKSIISEDNKNLCTYDGNNSFTFPVHKWSHIDITIKMRADSEHVYITESTPLYDAIEYKFNICNPNCQIDVNNKLVELLGDCEIIKQSISNE